MRIPNVRQCCVCAAVLWLSASAFAQTPQTLTAEDRTAILEILVDTKPEFARAVRKESR